MTDQEMKIQLLHRSNMIDTIVIHVFGCLIYFKGIIFVSSIPQNIIIEKRVILPWKK